MKAIITHVGEIREEPEGKFHLKDWSFDARGGPILFGKDENGGTTFMGYSMKELVAIAQTNLYK